jgi:hypothetical protein
LNSGVGHASGYVVESEVGSGSYMRARRLIAIAQNGAWRSLKTRHRDHRIRRIAMSLGG